MNQGMFLTSGTLEGLSIEGEGKLFCEMGSFCFPFRQLPVSIAILCLVVIPTATLLSG